MSFLLPNEYNLTISRHELIYPEGYLEAEAEKEKVKEKEGGKTGKGKKRKAGEDSQESQEEEDGSQDSQEEESHTSKKQKTVVFKIPAEWSKLIDEDSKNANTWAQVGEYQPFVDLIKLFCWESTNH